MGILSREGYIGSAVAAYSPSGKSGLGMIRLATMYFIVLVRLIQACTYIARAAIEARIASLIVGCIFGIIGTIFVILCVGQIGAAVGKRRALGINWGRLHFDVVLGFFAIVSAALMVVQFLSTGNTRRAGLFVAWCVVWVLLAIFAWIAQKPGTQDTYV